MSDTMNFPILVQEMTDGSVQIRIPAPSRQRIGEELRLAHDDLRGRLEDSPPDKGTAEHARTGLGLLESLAVAVEGAKEK